MPGEFFFMSIGGLGVSLAGFGGLIAALTPRKAAASAVTRWRIANLVLWGLQLTFIGFGIVALDAIVEDASTTARVASGAAALVHVWRFRAARPGPAWPRESERRATQWFTAIFTLVMAGNVVVGSVGYLHAIMVILLTGPASVFATGVREIFDDAFREARETRA